MALLLTHIHQVEITSQCNLRCPYCTSPNLQRPKVHMDRPTFERALLWAKTLYDRTPGQPEFNLAGIGESTMHPNFAEYLEHARQVMGWDVDFVLATNGLLVDRQLASLLAANRVKTWVSFHRPEKAKPAFDLLNEFGVCHGVSIDPAVHPINWAGQVKWFNNNPTTGQVCQWLYYGRAMVMADGRITTCCLDASGAGVIGDVNDDPHPIEMKPYELCKTCHLRVPE